LTQLTSRDVANKFFDAMETLTWRAANLQPDDIRRFVDAPRRLWNRRTQLPGLILEKGTHWFLTNGKQPDPESPGGAESHPED
jgi:hypothetical protein